MITTASIERLHATLRERLASLTPPGARARPPHADAARTYLSGTVYNCCTPHTSLAHAGGKTTPGDGRWHHGSWLERARTLVVSRPAASVDTPQATGHPSHAMKRLMARWCGDHGELWSYRLLNVGYKIVFSF